MSRVKRDKTRLTPRPSPPAERPPHRVIRTRPGRAHGRRGRPPVYCTHNTQPTVGVKRKSEPPRAAPERPAARRAPLACSWPLPRCSPVSRRCSVPAARLVRWPAAARRPARWPAVRWSACAIDRWSISTTSCRPPVRSEGNSDSPPPSPPPPARCRAWSCASPSSPSRAPRHQARAPVGLVAELCVVALERAGGVGAELRAAPSRSPRRNEDRAFAQDRRSGLLC